MTSDDETKRIVRDWLVDGVAELPDRLFDAVLADLPTTTRRRGPWPARALAWIPGGARRGAAAAAVVITLAVGIVLVARPGGISGPAAPPASLRPSPIPSVVGSVPPGYQTAPPFISTPAPLVPATQLPDPAGSPVPADLIGRGYNVDPPEFQGDQELVLSLRAATDPHCLAMLGGRSTCFTILWTPNYPSHRDDPGVRGPARIVGGQLVLTFALVPYDPACEGTSSAYSIVAGGTTLRGVGVPACSFQAFAQR